MADTLEVHVFGGKQGESIVVRLPNDTWGVVDNYTPNLEDPHSNQTLRFLQSRQVTKLEFLCLTHPHEDHYRGMGYFLEKLEVKNFWVFGALTHNKLSALVAEVLEAKLESLNEPAEKELEQIQLNELVTILDCAHKKCRDRQLKLTRLQISQPLLELTLDPPLKITAMGPSGRMATVYEDSLSACFDRTNRNKFLAERVRNVHHNTISGGLLIEYGEVRICLGGDMETESWKDAMEEFLPQGRLASVLVKASHHASTNGYCAGLWAGFSPNKQAAAVFTAYTKSHLPSAEGVSHIFEHAGLVYTTSLPALELSTRAVRTGDPDAFSGVSVEALAALRTLFPDARKRSEDFEGRCSFTLDQTGLLSVEVDGSAGPVRAFAFPTSPTG